MGVGGGGGGWLDQLRLKLTQSPTRVGVKVGTEFGKNKTRVESVQLGKTLKRPGLSQTLICF